MSFGAPCAPRSCWIGSFTACIAWRLKLGPDLIGQGLLNSLELLAALVGVLVKHQLRSAWQDNDIVLLFQGNSLSATGWILAHSSFDNKCPLHLAIACTLASFYLMEHGIPHYAHHCLAGKENLVLTDALSCDFHITEDAASSLTCRSISHHNSYRRNPLPVQSQLVGAVFAGLP